MFQGFAIACVLAAAVFCGSHRAAAQAGAGRMGLPQDWSHRHVVFSSTQNTPLLLKIRQDPRLLHHWVVQNASRFRFSRADSAGTEEIADELQAAINGEAGRQKRVDWSVSLGGTNSILPRTQYPAKYNFDVNAPPDCVNDYAVFPTNRAGAANQATIVGFNQLYSTQGAAGGLCNHNGPAVKWAYQTGSAVGSSPMLSLDGTKVAFVSRIPGIVHVLTIGTIGSNGTSVTAPAVPGAGNNAVDVQVALSGGQPVSFSSLFVDYVNDAGYVGDDAGVLHKIAGVFKGAPSEVMAGWPITVPTAGAGLNDPVFDSVSQNVFVTDRGGNLSYVLEAGSTTGTCASGMPPCLGSASVAVSGGSAIVDSPVVDFVTGRVFSETASSNAGTVCATAPACAQIVQTDTALGDVVRVDVGQRDVNAARPLHNGAFDISYLNNVSTGFYYVCGKANNATLDPTLYRIGFNGAGLMNSVADAATLRLARTAGQCSPITEFFNSGSNPTKDWLFVAVNTRCGNTPVLPGGCVMSYDITNGMPTALTAAVAERNGTSGIIVDNVSQAAQASNIYFTNEGTGACGDGIATGGCAVKLTQSGLQ
jgi:hypothetical protein